MNAEIIPWHRHKRAPIRDDGLGGCLVCRSYEGEMPTDCPGREMTDRERELVLNGEIDYRASQGGWTAWTRWKEMRARGEYD